MKLPPQIGDRVIVSDWAQFETTISLVEDYDGHSTMLHLRWDLGDGKPHTSHVWLHDEGKTWIRYEDRKVLN